MTAIRSSTQVVGQQAPQTSYNDAFKQLGMEEFLQMMITEMQSQDPLDPMDTTQILDQISQIRDVVASDRLTETLESVFLGQSMATASSLIGRLIMALTDGGDVITGRVDSVSILEGEPKLNVGGQSVDLKNVSKILADSADTEGEQSS